MDVDKLEARSWIAVSDAFTTIAFRVHRSHFLLQKGMRLLHEGVTE
jgi:hypothetical protein